MRYSRLLLLVFLLGALHTSATAQSYDCTAQTEVPDSECEVLVTLYSATDGDNWTHNSGWLDADIPISQWYSITVTGGGVTEINLYNNKLSGTIPPELGQLSNLQNLYLHGRLGPYSDHQLSGSIPPELGQLSNLRELRLSNNQLSGSIPPELGQLSNLRELSLYYNQLSGSIPPELGQLSNLREELRLEINQLSGSIPPELGQLSNLQSLNLAINQLSGSVPPELGQLANLQTFNLSRNGGLTGALPDALTNLSLTFFGFSGTDLCEPPDAAFQAWLDGIDTLQRSGLVCSGGGLTASITFRVDMSREEALGNVGPGTVVGVQGSLAPLDWDSTTPLSDPDGDGVYEGAVTFTEEPGSTLEYKYVYVPAGSNTPVYEGQVGSGDSGNRTLVYDGEETLSVVFWNNVTGVGTEEEAVPSSFALEGNYPNPFNPVTVIPYELPQASFVTLKVFDTLGQEVATLEGRRRTAGHHEVTFDASGLPSGVYVYTLQAGAHRESRKLVLMK